MRPIRSDIRRNGVFPWTGPTPLLLVAALSSDGAVHVGDPEAVIDVQPNPVFIIENHSTFVGDSESRRWKATPR